VKNSEQRWDADFPIREEVEDHTGRARAFVITCHEGGLGFTVRAEEEGRRGAGYQFAAYSETSPYSALGRLRQKMYRGLATRHVTGPPRWVSNAARQGLSGRITSDGKGGVALVVDGIALGIEDLASILASHEGWALELQIVDALE
jgi:hypothetical protein